MIKVDKSYDQVVLFLTLMLGTFTSQLMFVFPYVNTDEWFPLLCTLLSGAMIFFYLTMTVQPGYMKGQSKIPFVRLVERFDANLLCPGCEIICTADSRHCYACN